MKFEQVQKHAEDALTILEERLELDVVPDDDTKPVEQPIKVNGELPDDESDATKKIKDMTENVMRRLPRKPTQISNAGFPAEILSGNALVRIIGNHVKLKLTYTASVMPETGLLIDFQIECRYRIASRT